MGLTAHDIASQFRPFYLCAFNADASTNLCKHYTDMVLPKIYLGPTDDSLLDFRVDLEWTPAHSPHGPYLKPNGSADAGQPDASNGTADTINVPMEA